MMQDRSIIMFSSRWNKAVSSASTIYQVNHLFLPLSEKPSLFILSPHLNLFLDSLLSSTCIIYSCTIHMVYYNSITVSFIIWYIKQEWCLATNVDINNGSLSKKEVHFFHVKEVYYKGPGLSWQYHAPQEPRLLLSFCLMAQQWLSPSVSPSAPRQLLKLQPSIPYSRQEANGMGKDQKGKCQLSGLIFKSHLTGLFIPLSVREAEK